MPVTKTILDEWKEQLDEFDAKVDKTLAQIRQYKADIAQIKVDILNEIHNGQFIRDDECIVISAPKIIIGNVNKDGTLRSENGEVILRGTALQFDGAGETGKLKMRATKIEQYAVDPGLDGKEDVVHADSQIVSQAMAICLDSQHPALTDAYKGVFLAPPVITGIKIQSHDGIAVIATPENIERRKKADKLITDLAGELQNRQDAIAVKKNAIVAKLTALKTTLNQNELLNRNDQDLTKSNILALDDLAVALKAELPIINNMLAEYAALVSESAEIERKMQACQKIIDEVNANINTYKATTGKKLLLQSEKIEIHSKDGDGTWRTNEGAGVDIRANDINLRSTLVANDNENAEVLTPEAAKGRVNIHARNVSIITADCKEYDFDQDGKLKKAKYPLVGEVSIRSKTVNIDSVDYEKEENVADKLKETALTPGGKINMRANKVRVRTVDQTGKAVGRFSVNSQKITLKSVDIAEFPKEAQIDAQGNIVPQSTKGKNKTLTAGSEMLIMSEKMNIGYQKDGVCSKEISVTSTENMSVSGKDTLVAAQGMTLNMHDNTVELHAGGNPIDIAGKTITVNGDSTFNGKMTTGNVAAANVKVDGQLSSMDIHDGEEVPTTAPQSPEPKKPENSEMDDDDADDEANAV